MSATSRPATVRRVRATWAGRASAGWQHVKISRSRSSSSVSAGSSISAAAASLDGSVDARRSRSRARLRAVVASHAAGFGGTPSVGQRATAAAKASAVASSASDQSPVTRINPATMRVQSVRCALATASAAARSSSVDRPAGHRPDLDAPVVRHRVPGHVVDGLVEVVALEQVVADDPLLGLGVRPVGHEHLAAAHAHRGRVLQRTQHVAAQADAAALALGDPLVDVRAVAPGSSGSVSVAMNSRYSMDPPDRRRYGRTTIGEPAQTTPHEDFSTRFAVASSWVRVR